MCVCPKRKGLQHTYTRRYFPWLHVSLYKSFLWPSTLPIEHHLCLEIKQRFYFLKDGLRLWSRNELEPSSGQCVMRGVFWERILLSNKRRITWEVGFATQPPVPGPWVCVKGNRVLKTVLERPRDILQLPTSGFLVYEIQLFFLQHW